MSRFEMERQPEIEEGDLDAALLPDRGADPGKRLGGALDGRGDRRDVPAAGADVLERRARQRVVGEAREKILQRRLRLVACGRRRPARAHRPR